MSFNFNKIVIGTAQFGTHYGISSKSIVNNKKVLEIIEVAKKIELILLKPLLTILMLLKYLKKSH